LIEAGIAWLPPLLWRLDKHWQRLRSETPHLKRPPSEYIREHVWLTTQPMEEPERRKHFTDMVEWIGIDRLCSPPTIRIGISTTQCGAYLSVLATMPAKHYSAAMPEGYTVWPDGAPCHQACF
jgi:hypothetical protein